MNFRTNTKDVVPAPVTGPSVTLSAMLSEAKRKDFTLRAVVARLDAADAADRLWTAKRQADREAKRLDLGEP